MRSKTILIVCLFIVFTILFIALFDSYLSMNASHTKVKKDFLVRLQQSIDNNEDGISYRTNRYQLNGEQYIGRIYVVNDREDIKFVKDILSRCKAIKEVRNYKPTDIRVFVGGIDIGCTGANGDYYWDTKNGKSFGYYLSKDYNNRLWDFLNSLDYLNNEAN